jgi:arylsulfatase A-like enzyme
MINMNEIVGTRNILFITVDTLRYDVAVREEANNNTPNINSLGKWEKRHSPGSFTYAAHQAFFAGFLPTPVSPTKHERLFSVRFPGSETTGGNSYIFDAPDIITGLRSLGYHTVCVGGVGFFNKSSPLGNVIPSLFAESHWDTALGVTDRNSTRNQVNCCLNALENVEVSKKVFLFLNISALHQPNYFYLEGAKSDTIDSHAAALRYVDGELKPLFEAFAEKGPGFGVICSDHGTAYGEDGYRGHRLAHEVVWTVPYMEFLF